MVSKCGAGEAFLSIVDSVFEVMMDLLFCDIDGTISQKCSMTAITEWLSSSMATVMGTTTWQQRECFHLSLFSGAHGVLDLSVFLLEF